MKVNKGAYSEYAIAAFARAAEKNYPRKAERGWEEAVRADFAAVRCVFDELMEKKPEIVYAVMAVYVPYRGDTCHIPRRVLHERVLAHAAHSSYSEESVYRMLAKARRMFAERRGLTTG